MLPRPRALTLYVFFFIQMLLMLPIALAVLTVRQWLYSEDKIYSTGKLLHAIYIDKKYLCNLQV